MKEEINRRKFFNAALRGSILIGLSAMTGIFLTREKSVTHESCDIDFICQDCSKNKGCKLPQAFIYRRKNNTQ